MTGAQVMGTLVFLLVLGSALVLLLRSGWQLARGGWRAAGRSARTLVWIGGAYALLLVALALAMPRRYQAAGQRECFDDWCVAALSATRAGAAPRSCPQRGDVWLVRLEVSSQAKRVRQRASDATALVEDAAGRRYADCGVVPGPGGVRTLRDRLGPGESYGVTLAYALPPGRFPAGVVVRHGAFPGVLIVGDDQAAFHPPTLLRLRRGG